jgi:hypothetical protein
MTSLQVMKLDDNPLRYPPKEILVYNTLTSPTGPATENELDDMAITARVKLFLKQKAANDRSETESGGEESSEGTETPRLPRRVMSRRFPIKVNGTEVPDLRSPAFTPRPPPIPSRSHYRGLSQQNAALRRPGVMPLTIGSANERVRSNSDALVPNLGDPKDRVAGRSRRMGIVSMSKRAQELGTVDEMKANNRFSHYRGLSHGSAMQDVANGNARSPASPADSVPQRATYVKRLSSLPERKQESLSPDPVIEAAKAILYALFLVHPLLEDLLGVTTDLLDVTTDPASKRTSLEMVVYNATSHVKALEKDIRDYDTYTQEDEEAPPRSNENVHRTCVTCVSAYITICGLVQRNAHALLTERDPRYVRLLLLNIFGSIAEIRNASAAFAKARQDRGDFLNPRITGPQPDYEEEEELRGPTMDQSKSKYGYDRLTDGDDRGSSVKAQIMGVQSMQRDTVPVDDQARNLAMERGTRARKPTMKATTRTRAPTMDVTTNGKVLTMESAARSRRPTAIGPRLTRDRSVTPTERPEVSQSPYYRYQELTEENMVNLKVGQPPADFTIALKSALNNATPRSGHLFVSSPSVTMTGGDFTDEDVQFEKIYLGLRDTIEMAERLLPLIRDHFMTAWKLSTQDSRPQATDSVWNTLISMCDKAGVSGPKLKALLSTIKLKDPGARTKSFWQLVHEFLGVSR